MTYFNDNEQGRLRTVFAAVISDAPMAPELAALADVSQPLIPPNRPRRMRGVAVMATAAAAMLMVVGVAGLLVLRDSDGAVDETMQSGIGSSPTVEALLEQSSDEYIPGTGLHVASYVGPGGPVDFYSYEANIEIPEFIDGELVVPGRTLRGYCFSYGPSGQPPGNGGCGSEPGYPAETPLLSGDVADDGSGMGLVLVPSDVVEVVLEFKDETQISVRPASGVAYAVWQSGGFPHAEVIQADGTRERVRPPS